MYGICIHAPMPAEISKLRLPRTLYTAYAYICILFIYVPHSKDEKHICKQELATCHKICSGSKPQFMYDRKLCTVVLELFPHAKPTCSSMAILYSLQPLLYYYKLFMLHDDKAYTLNCLRNLTCVCT